MYIFIQYWAVVSKIKFLKIGNYLADQESGLRVSLSLSVCIGWNALTHTSTFTGSYCRQRSIVSKHLNQITSKQNRNIEDYPRAAQLPVINRFIIEFYSDNQPAVCLQPPNDSTLFQKTALLSRSKKIENTKSTLRHCICSLICQH